MRRARWNPTTKGWLCHAVMVAIAVTLSACGYPRLAALGGDDVSNDGGGDPPAKAAACAGAVYVFTRTGVTWRFSS